MSRPAASSRHWARNPTMVSSLQVRTTFYPSLLHLLTHCLDCLILGWTNCTVIRADKSYETFDFWQLLAYFGKRNVIKSYQIIWGDVCGKLPWHHNIKLVFFFLLLCLLVFLSFHHSDQMSEGSQVSSRAEQLKTQTSAFTYTIP